MKYFLGLNPLRIFAALSVLAFHVMGTDGWAEVPMHGPLAWIRGGWVGVDAFFVTSGLVVGQSAFSGFRKYGAAFRRRFVAHRLARIVPLYIVTGLVCILLINPAPLLGKDSIWQALSHLLFIHNFWMNTIMAINPPSWSLAAEMQLYLILLIASVWLSRLSAGWIALISVAVALLYRSCAYFFANASSAGDTAVLQHVVYQTPGMIDSFGLGVAASVAIARGNLARIGPFACAMLIALGLYGLSMGSLITPQVIDSSIWQHPVYAVTMQTLIAFAALALVLGCALLPMRGDTRLARAFKHGGDLSYGIYLWHFALLSAAQKFTSLSGWALLALVSITTIVAAESTWRVIEQPVLRRFK